MAWYNPATWAPVDKVQNYQKQHGVFGFDPTPNASIVGTVRNMAAGNFNTAPDTNYQPKQPSQPNYPQQVQGVQTSGVSDVNTGGTDKYAQWGGQDKYNSLASGFDTQKQNIYGSAQDAATSAANGLHGNILDFLDSLRTGQQALDERGVQNELAKRQGTASILDMVGNGIRSSGSFLANRNASDSSAGDQIARAYGTLGQRQLGGINNQYELENRNIGLDQANFNTQTASGLRKFDDNKIQTVNNIVAQARNGLAQLDAAMADADMPTRIQLEQEKEKIKQQALATLGQYDQELSQGVAGITPAGMDANRRTAADLATRGVAASNPFDFSAQAPAMLQNSGPFASELPLFTLNRQRRQEA